jgi:hypothetical protein
MRANGKRIPWAGLAAWAGGTAVLAAAALSRSAEYDESYTLLLTAGTPRPSWPTAIFTAGAARAVFAGHAGLAQIARDLRTTDVHPPLYFWLVGGWRWLAGPSLLDARALSVILGAVALALVAATARAARVPPGLAMILTVGCYGFTYTSAIARGFALAQALSLAGVFMALRASPAGGGASPDNPPKAAGGGESRPAIRAVLAGLLLGAAVLSNYLAAFVASATLLWLLRRPRVGAIGAAAFVVPLPLAVWFFLAQRDTRQGQFPPFTLGSALARLARYAGANLFGGLPLYVGDAGRGPLTAALALLIAGLVGLIVLRWRRIATPHGRWLLGLAAVAPPIGLLALGRVFDVVPVELRYLAFACPFVALLLAAALATLPAWGRRGVLAVTIATQTAGLLGMMTRPETMQPARATARAAGALARGGVVLLPRGNDGVGVVGAFLLEAPAWLRISLVPAADSIADLPAHLRDARRVVLALIAVDAASRASTATMRASFAADACWRPAGRGSNVLAYDRICDGEGDDLRRLHANQAQAPGR